MKATASSAGGRPVRKPWNPPRFECVEAELLGVGHGKTYFDYDDANSPGGRDNDPDLAAHPSYDQQNPYNS